ncbi:hypothetical protein SBOR_4302 [Sclerotinia borealis F-4128]|uniref:F-box domain-containing protein n=1 Tax=Sclerotinia borealis (strain F-4128) TaxID=1432307 RepID=W9CLF2_SCLBF|nr:hypothetical protein SBOR_4302 [Sclerotinia borealis F-4128]
MEIFQHTLLYLDIETLVNVRRCSQHCRLAVTSTLEWKEVIENAPDALRAILSTEMGSHITLLKLHQALTNPECEFCVENSNGPEYLDDEKVLGGFLSLLEGKRACAYCLRNDVSLRTVHYIDLVRLQLRPDTAVSFRFDKVYPKLRTIPGWYGHKRYKMAERLVLVPLSSIEMITGKPLNACDTSVLQHSPHEVPIPRHPYEERGRMNKQLGPHNGYIGFERNEDVARRYMTAIEFSFFGKTKIYPNHKSRATFHRCVECLLQERYHGMQFLESFQQGDADEVIIACAGNIYKRETRQWLNDVKAEKRHARRFHEVIEEDERDWRVGIDAPVFNLKDPETWKILRLHGYGEVTPNP